MWVNHYMLLWGQPLLIIPHSLVSLAVLYKSCSNSCNNGTLFYGEPEVATALWEGPSSFSFQVHVAVEVEVEVEVEVACAA